MLIAGLGGIYAEALNATTTWAMPVERDVLERDIAASPLGRVLSSARWKYPDALPALIALLLALQSAALAYGDAVQAIDVNPVILGAGAGGAIAVDALVIPRS